MTTPHNDDGGRPELNFAAGVATIRLRRPAQHNRIDPDDVAVLRGYLGSVSARRDVSSLVITGTGAETFSSGYTVDAIVARLDRNFEDFLDEVERFPLPTLAALNGSAYGGATDLALCCDFRIGVTGSRMFMPAARFGLHYFPGGLRRYVKVLGIAQAKRLVLTGQSIDAAEMLRIGFLTELVPAEALAERVASYTDAIAGCYIPVVASMKRQLDAVSDNQATEQATSRNEYEASLKSPELVRRLAAMGASND